MEEIFKKYPTLERVLQDKSDIDPILTILSKG